MASSIKIPYTDAPPPPLIHSAVEEGGEGRGGRGSRSTQLEFRRAFIAPFSSIISCVISNFFAT
jgi:hypothetical protein